MNKSLRMHMIRSANERLQSRRKWQAQNTLLEREIKEIEGDSVACSQLKKNSKKV